MDMVARRLFGYTVVALIIFILFDVFSGFVGNAWKNYMQAITFEPTKEESLRRIADSLDSIKHKINISDNQK